CDLKPRLHLNHGSSLNLRRFYNFTQNPALGFAERTTFVDANFVADFCDVLFIMGLKNRATTQKLAVFFVTDLTINQNGDGFLHLVADNFANYRNSSASGPLSDFLFAHICTYYLTSF